MIQQTDNAVALEFVRRFGDLCLQDKESRAPKVLVDVIFAPEDKALREHAEAMEREFGPRKESKTGQEKDHNTSFEFVALWWSEVIEDDTMGNAALARRGVFSYEDTETGLWKGLSGIPVRLPYQIRYYTTKLSKANEFIKRYTYWKQKEYPIEFNYEMDKGVLLPMQATTTLPGTARKETSDWYTVGKYFIVKAELDVRTAIVERNTQYRITEIDVTMTQDNSPNTDTELYTQQIDENTSDA